VSPLTRLETSVLSMMVGGMVTVRLVGGPLMLTL
jgi:hypothetical protein